MLDIGDFALSLSVLSDLVTHYNYSSLSTSLISRPLTPLSMLVSGPNQARHDVRNSVRPQEGVEAAGVCRPRSQCDLPVPGTQEWQGPCYWRGGQESQSLGSREAELHHEFIR